MNAHLKKILMLAMAVCIGLAALPARSWALAEAGTFSIQPEFGYYGVSQKPMSSFVTFGGSAHYFVMDGLSLGAEGLAYSFYQDSHYGHHDYTANPWAFGFNALVRFYPVHTNNMGFYIGSGIGGLFSGENIPYRSGWRDQGETSSLTVPVDLGFVYNFTDNIGIEVAGRYQRIGFTDHGMDSWGGHASLRFSF